MEKHGCRMRLVKVRTGIGYVVMAMLQCDDDRGNHLIIGAAKCLQFRSKSKRLSVSKLCSIMNFYEFNLS